VGKRRRPSVKPSAFALARCANGWIASKRKAWPACRIAAPGPFDGATCLLTLHFLGVVGPRLYSDVPSGPTGLASTYETMMRHNLAALIAGMLKN